MKKETTKEILRRAAENFPEDNLHPYDMIIDKNGFDAICEFAGQMNGFTIYVPSLRTIFAKCLEKEARKEFAEGNASAASLARKYGFSERHMLNMVKFP